MHNYRQLGKHSQMPYLLISATDSEFYRQRGGQAGQWMVRLNACCDSSVRNSSTLGTYVIHMYVDEASVH
jgi:hypothetical protein